MAHHDTFVSRVGLVTVTSDKCCVGCRRYTPTVGKTFEIDERESILNHDGCPVRNGVVITCEHRDSCQFVPHETIN